MKTIPAGVLISVALLVFGCTQKVNNPADVQAIKKSVDDYVKVFNAEDVNVVAALMTDKAIYYAIYSVPVAVGREAVQSLELAVFGLFKPEFSAPIEDVRVVGEALVAILSIENPEGQKRAEAEETVIRFGPRSAWSANTRTGRSVGGTWTGEIDLSTGTASGTWTVRDTAGQVVLRGTWSAAKEAREWRGAWRALMVGQTKERSGTWSSELQLPPNSPLGSLFEQAVQQVINGSWQSAGQSGAWSIRAVR